MQAVTNSVKEKEQKMFVANKSIARIVVSVYLKVNL